MKYISLTIALLLTACGSVRYVQVHPELRPYVQRFATYGDVGIHNLIAKFGPLDDVETQSGNDAVGLCTTGIPTPTITIARDYWSTITEVQREELMFHELGHCVLFRSHREAKFKDGCPKSIMYHEVLPEACMQAHRIEYMVELYGRTGW